MSGDPNPTGDPTSATGDLTMGDLIVDVRAAQGAGASRGYCVMRSPQGHRELHLTVALRPAELWRASTIWVRHLDGRAIRVHVRDNLYARLAARAVDRGPETIAKGFAAEAAPPHATAGSSLRRWKGRRRLRLCTSRRLFLVLVLLLFFLKLLEKLMHVARGGDSTRASRRLDELRGPRARRFRLRGARASSVRGRADRGLRGRRACSRISARF